MKKQPINLNNGIKLCAFCKSWYDPTNSAITPRNPRMGSWEYNIEAKGVCVKTNLTYSAGRIACRDYECKIPK